LISNNIIRFLLTKSNLSIRIIYRNDNGGFEMKNTELRSKVVSLANRLAPRMGGNKSAAFIRAWQIVKAGGLELSVKGTSFGNRQEALKRLATYVPDQVRAVLVPEPENPVDRNAVVVLAGVNGGKGLFKLGYVPRDMAAVVVSAMPAKLPTMRVVSGTWGWSGKTTYGARVALAV
jgi:hypothetical protein